MVKRKKGRNESHSLYPTWRNMRYRCNCSTSHKYKYYGAKGVKVCERWDDFWKFVEDMGERPSNHHSIDRINTNGDYEPSNCRWATYKEQNRNKISNVIDKKKADIVRQKIGSGESSLTISKEMQLPLTCVKNIKFNSTWV